MQHHDLTEQFLSERSSKIHSKSLQHHRKSSERTKFLPLSGNHQAAAIGKQEQGERKKRETVNLSLKLIHLFSEFRPQLFGVSAGVFRDE